MPAKKQDLIITVDNGAIRLSGSLKSGGPRNTFRQLSQLIDAEPKQTVFIDLTDITDCDNLGTAVLVELQDYAATRQKVVELHNVRPEIQSMINRFNIPAEPISDSSSSLPFAAQIGDKVNKLWEELGHLLVLISESVYWSLVALWNPKGHRKGAVGAQALAIGVGALPVISVIALLIGVVLALQSAAQLRQFGANIYVADLVVISMAREMGPLMTAIILAGRSGAAIAAEISSMTVSEETDALVTMGIKPIRYIVVPKILGIVITAPLLSLVATVLGIIGGFIIAINTLDLSPQAFYLEGLTALFMKDIVTGLIKSVVFAWLIVILAAYYGFRVTGGPEGVGRATTKAVVASIFAVIVADSILGLLFYLE